MQSSFLYRASLSLYIYIYIYRYVLSCLFSLSLSLSLIYKYIYNLSFHLQALSIKEGAVPEWLEQRYKSKWKHKKTTPEQKAASKDEQKEERAEKKRKRLDEEKELCKVMEPSCRHQIPRFVYTATSERFQHK